MTARHWIEPEYSKGEVDRTGRALSERERGDERERALDVLNNWRAAHAFPLNTFQNGLRAKSAEVSKRILVSQRLKRTESTVAKLERFPRMKLSRMQDMGGCRSVTENVEQIARLREGLRRSRMKHKRVREYDYMAQPQPSGYRGHHIVYSYRGRNKAFNGLHIEVQLRSELQHAWAAAVEVVGAFMGQALKAGEGDSGWLRFFALAGASLALKEGGAPVPGTPSDPQELQRKTRRISESLNVSGRLREYRSLIRPRPVHRQVKGREARYYLLERNPSHQTTYVMEFGGGRREIARATEEYASAERRIGGVLGAEAVLVSADSLSAVRRAYPSYYADTDRFLKELQMVNGG